jgi:hypothetical protein
MGVTRTSFDGFQDQVCLGLIAFKLLIEGGGLCRKRSIRLSL